MELKYFIKNIIKLFVNIATTIQDMNIMTFIYGSNQKIEAPKEYIIKPKEPRIQMWWESLLKVLDTIEAHLGREVTYGKNYITRFPFYTDGKVFHTEGQVKMFIMWERRISQHKKLADITVQMPVDNLKEFEESLSTMSMKSVATILLDVAPWKVHFAHLIYATKLGVYIDFLLDYRLIGNKAEEKYYDGHSKWFIKYKFGMALVLGRSMWTG